MNKKFSGEYTHELVKTSSVVSPIELVLLAAQRAREIKEEGKSRNKHSLAMDALMDFHNHPENVDLARENLISKLQKPKPIAVQREEDIGE